MALGTAHTSWPCIWRSNITQKRDQIPALVDVKDPTVVFNQLQKSVATYEKELKQQQEELKRERTKNIETLEAPSKPDQQKRKQQSELDADSLQWSEAKTRALLIDAMLLQAGWNIQNQEQWVSKWR